jgi:hypothetical protein
MRSVSRWHCFREFLNRYECSIDVRELVSVEDVMTEMNLGPNGALVYAMEYLVTNIDWLQVVVLVVVVVVAVLSFVTNRCL